MTPGRYLKLRREAAGLAIEDVPLPLESVQAIESDERAPTDIELWGLTLAFPFDVAVLGAIARGITPRICRQCGCTEFDPCDDGGIGCCWVEEDLCSACERFVTCECGAEIDTDTFGECHSCGSEAA